MAASADPPDPGYPCPRRQPEDHEREQIRTPMQCPEGAAVCAGREERRVAERRHAPVAEEKIERHRENRENQRLRGHVDPEPVGRPGGHADQEQQKCQQAKRSPPERGSPQTRHCRRPSSPRGRTSKTTAITAKIDAASNPPRISGPKALATPTRSAPRIAPSIHPSPPTTTTTSTSTRMLSSMPGYTLRYGPTTTPASPASAAPKANVAVNTRLRSIPSRPSISRSATPARRMAPTFVLRQATTRTVATSVAKRITNSLYVANGTPRI